ncbi:hypothetical protein [Streptomyces sp. NPDC056069]|uniref:hypothetical protein n=1 Tax=Streptomyces sp. NPDC056069 TaxID=3345702 RepID=UPI0035DD76ED
MDRHTYSPLAPDPDVHETGGLDGPNPAGRLVNADEFGHGMRRVYSDTPAAPVAHARMRTMPHWSTTSDEPCRPNGGRADDSDNGLAPGFPSSSGTPHPEHLSTHPHHHLPRNTVPPRAAPSSVSAAGWRPGGAVEDDQFGDELRAVRGGRR